MKRLFIAVGLLVLLLTGAAVNAGVLTRLTGELTEQLEQAQALAEADRWDEAVACTRAVRVRWQAHLPYLSVVIRHGDSDRVQQELETALRLLERRSRLEYTQVNTQLILRLELLAEAEQLTLANVL